MTTTPRSIGDDSLSESWVDIGAGSGRVTPVAVAGLVTGQGSPISVTYSGQLNIGEEYLRLLKEAQESNPPSARVSLASSLRGSRCESPKSPPNSPNNELANEDEELKDIFINKESAEKANPSNEWLINYWNVQNQRVSKSEVSVKKTNLSLRRAKYDGKSIFSKEMLYTLFLSNLLSFLLGTGIGMWISKRSSAVISQ